jgi:hypothetical protein
VRLWGRHHVARTRRNQPDAECLVQTYTRNLLTHWKSSNAASFAMNHLFPDEALVTKLLKVLDTLIRHSDAVDIRHTHRVTHIKNTR